MSGKMNSNVNSNMNSCSKLQMKSVLVWEVRNAHRDNVIPFTTNGRKGPVASETVATEWSIESEEDHATKESGVKVTMVSSGFGEVAQTSAQTTAQTTKMCLAA